jgi:hypothetical protein
MLQKNYLLCLVKKTNSYWNKKKKDFNLDLPDNHFSNSRIYDSQVVEIREDLSLIILMSTADEVNILSTPSYYSFTSFIYLPVYIFEVCMLLKNFLFNLISIRIVLFFQCNI